MTDKPDKPSDWAQMFLDTMHEKYTELQLERAATSFAFLDRPESHRRLAAIIELSIEYDRIRQIDIYATAWCTMAIEALIIGDLDEARTIAGYLLFEDERGHAREITRFSKFREMLLAIVEPVEKIQ